MADTINVKGLAEEDIQLLEKFAQFLRERNRQEQPCPDRIEFSSWALGVKGKLSREEIYDYL